MNGAVVIRQILFTGGDQCIPVLFCVLGQGEEDHVSKLGLGESLTASEIELPASAELVGSGDEVVVSCHAPVEETEPEETQNIEHDPLGHLARIAGFDDTDEWWEYQFEMTRSAEAFNAIAIAMRSLREEFPTEKEDTFFVYLQTEIYEKKLATLHFPSSCLLQMEKNVNYGGHFARVVDSSPRHVLESSTKQGVCTCTLFHFMESENAI